MRPTPVPILAIYILIVGKALVTLAFYVAYIGDDFDMASPEIFVWTPLVTYGYSMFLILAFLEGRNLLGVRICLGIDFAAALPLLVYPGMIISALLFGLTYLESTKFYFRREKDRE